jgi:ribosomal protein L40E
MDMTEASKEVVYCNHCGTANPPRAAICCNCGHVHAREIVVPPPKESAIVVEQWFWIALRIICGVGLSVGGVVPLSGATVNAALLGRIFGALAIPVVIAAVFGNGNWARSSRWFLGAALIVPVVRYVVAVFGRIHLR